jgi:UDP-N-acetylenolpyruvoylglucosamine reductase
LVDPATAERIIAYDESGKTALEIKKMNQVHGGSAQRVSAAHVMLAAGFKRGQRWGQVKLNDQNLLKIEALEGATAQDVYTLMRHIQDTCLASIGVKLEPEARILGSFTVEAENPQQTS